MATVADRTNKLRAELLSECQISQSKIVWNMRAMNKNYQTALFLIALFVGFVLLFLAYVVLRDFSALPPPDFKAPI